MSVYKQLQEEGFSDEEIRDATLEEDSDRVTALIEEGYSPEEIFSAISEEDETPLDVLMPEETTPRIDTSGFSRKSILSLEIADEVYQEKIKKLDSSGQDPKAIALLKKKAELEFETIKDDEINKNKPAPTMGVAHEPKSFGEQSIDALEAITEPFKDPSELGLNYLKKMGTAIGGTAENAFNILTGSDINYYGNLRIEAKKEAEELDARIDPEGKAILSPTQATALAAELAAFGISKPLSMLSTEFWFGYVNEFNKSGDITDSISAGATQASIAGGSQLLLESGVNAYKVMKGGRKYSVGALELQERLNIPQHEFEAVLKDIPAEKQALAISNQYGGKAQGYQVAATADSTILQGKQMDAIAARSSYLDSATGRAGYQDIKTHTDILYQEMRDMTRSSEIIVDGSGLTNNLSEAHKISAFTDEMDRAIVSMQNQLADNPNLTFDELLEFRQKVNSNLSKTKADSRAKAVWSSMKDNVDDLIKTNAPKEQQKFVSDAIDQYKRTADQKEIIDIIEKHSKTPEKISRGTRGDIIAVDYNAAYKELSETKLNTPEMMSSMAILKQYGLKFGNDFSILKAVDVKPVERTKFYVAGEVLGWLKQTFVRFGEDFNTGVIQKEIKKAIALSDSPEVFATKIIKNKNIPDEIKGVLSENLSNMDTLKAQNIMKEKNVKSIMDNLKSKQKQLPPPPRIDAEITPQGQVVPPKAGEAMATQERIATELGKRQKGRGAAYDPKGEFKDPQFKKKDIEVELMDDATPQGLPSPKGTRDIIDVDVVETKSKKKLTEKTAKAYNKVSTEIANKQKEIKILKNALKGVGKLKTTSAKKKAMNKDYAKQIKKLNAEMVTLKKKLPKI